jgi:hypothetical protein
MASHSPASETSPAATQARRLLLSRLRISRPPAIAKVSFDNRAPSRRYVLGQSLQSDSLEVRRTAIYVALPVSWRMRGEAQRLKL